MTLQPEERRAVAAVLRFANLPRVESDAQALRCFKGVADFSELAGLRNQGVTVRGAEHYADVQTQVRQWLDQLGALAGRRKVAAEVAPILAQGVDAALVLQGGRLKTTYGIHSVEAACAFGLALILDEARGLTNRLKRCGWSKCGRFNLDLEPKGRPRRFCSSEHKEHADRETGAERVRRHRERTQ